LSKASDDASAGIKSILVAVDGSANALRAANRAISIAKGLGAELYIVTAITIPVLATGAMAPSLETYFESMEKDGKALVDGLAAQARKEGVKTATAILDNVTSAVYAITSYADEKHVDMIVVGSRGMGGFKRMLLGSVSSGVLNHAHCSVLVVR
jgi:nucleotide-binding universal stress UspA family protein